MVTRTALADHTDLVLDRWDLMDTAHMDVTDMDRDQDMDTALPLQERDSWGS